MSDNFHFSLPASRWGVSSRGSSLGVIKTQPCEKNKKMARLEPRELHSQPLAGYPAGRWERGKASGQGALVSLHN